MSPVTAQSMKPTKEQIQAFIPGIKARVMKAARHLSSSRMVRQMRHPGIDYQGCSKGAMAERVAERLCGVGIATVCLESLCIPAEVEIESVCRRFRIAESSEGKFGVIEADRAYLIARIEAERSIVQADEEKLAAIKAAGKVNYAIENPLQGKKSNVMALERALATLDKVAIPTHGVCPHCKAMVDVRVAARTAFEDALATYTTPR